MTASPAPASAPTARERARAIVGGSTGNLVEWYDWYAYAAFTLYFAPHFFPSDNPTAQLLGAAAVFAVGFFMRPLGAWIMGVYADRKGRKSGLALSVTLMCAGSLLIAIAPTYESAGLLAPALLVLARLMQGLSVGGEYGASATYLSEMAGKGRRGFFSSFQPIFAISCAAALAAWAQHGIGSRSAWAARIATRLHRSSISARDNRFFSRITHSSVCRITIASSPLRSCGIIGSSSRLMNESVRQTVRYAIWIS